MQTTKYRLHRQHTDTAGWEELTRLPNQSCKPTSKNSTISSNNNNRHPGEHISISRRILIKGSRGSLYKGWRAAIRILVQAVPIGKVLFHLQGMTDLIHRVITRLRGIQLLAPNPNQGFTGKPVQGLAGSNQNIGPGSPDRESSVSSPGYDGSYPQGHHEVAGNPATRIA